MSARRIGYLRVSTAEQRPDRQIDGLRYICDELHIEKTSATSKRRTVYESVITALKQGDFFVIWDLDRAFRSAKDALVELDRLRERGVEIHIANLSIDTSTPYGKLLYTFVSGLAEFERDLLSQRTREGLAAARGRGVRLGRPPKMTAAQIRAARKKLLGKSASTATIAAQYGVHPWTLHRAINRLFPSDLDEN